MRLFIRWQEITVLAVLTLLPILAQAWSLHYKELKDVAGLESFSAKESTYQDNSLDAKEQDRGTHIRGLKVFRDDIVSEQTIENIKLMPSESHQANVWGLAETDEKRYVQLMKNRSGLYWKGMGLSPVEILGINARNPVERKRFAQLYAEQLQEKMAKELAWQAAATEAKAEVNKGLPLIRPFNFNKFSPYNYHAINLKPNDKLFLLTGLNLNVRRVVSTLLKDIKENKKITLNIYFLGAPENHSIQDWANNQSISVSLVKKGVITLNSNEGIFSEIKNKKELPKLLLVRNGQVSAIDISRF